MNILITGSSGHIGSAVAECLGQQGRVMGLDRQPGLHTTRVGDIADDTLVRTVMRGVDAVVHTAGLHVPDLGRASPERLRRVNVDATRGEYDQTKLAAEALCRDAADARLSTVILRLARCFPEPDHMVAFYRMYRGVDRRDAAEAHRQAVTAPVSGSTTVNIAGTSPFEPEDMAAVWDDPRRSQRS
jgi:UDP-glucose 4-epimerase